MEKILTKRQAEQHIINATDSKNQSLQVEDKVIFCDYSRIPSIGVITHQVYSGRLAIVEISTGWKYYRYGKNLIKLTNDLLLSTEIENT